MCNELFIVVPKRTGAYSHSLWNLEVEQLDTEHLYFMLSESDLHKSKDSLKSTRMVRK